MPWLTVLNSEFTDQIEMKARSQSNKIPRSDQNITDRRHPFQLSRERTCGNEPRIHFLLNRIATPWKNLPKDTALAHSVSSFKSKLNLYLNKEGRNNYIYS